LDLIEGAARDCGFIFQRDRDIPGQQRYDALDLEDGDALATMAQVSLEVQSMVLGVQQSIH
jgi:hypothetical protein